MTFIVTVNLIWCVKSINSLFWKANVTIKLFVEFENKIFRAKRGKKEIIERMIFLFHIERSPHSPVHVHRNCWKLCVRVCVMSEPCELFRTHFVSKLEHEHTTDWHEKLLYFMSPKCFPSFAWACIGLIVWPLNAIIEFHLFFLWSSRLETRRTGTW